MKLYFCQTEGMMEIISFYDSNQFWGAMIKVIEADELPHI